MGSCHSDYHIAGDHIHTDITTRNIEEAQQKYRLGTVSNIGALTSLTGSKPSLFHSRAATVIHVWISNLKYL